MIMNFIVNQSKGQTVGTTLPYTRPCFTEYKSILASWETIEVLCISALVETIYILQFCR